MRLVTDQQISSTEVIAASLTEAGPAQATALIVLRARQKSQLTPQETVTSRAHRLDRRRADHPTPAASTSPRGRTAKAAKSPAGSDKADPVVACPACRARTGQASNRQVSPTHVSALIVERVTTPLRLDPQLLPAVEDAYSAMYSFDYTDPEESVEATLAVLSGDLREQFEADLDAQVVPPSRALRLGVCCHVVVGLPAYRS